MYYKFRLNPYCICCQTIEVIDMGYSSLATVKIWSPNHSGRRNHVIDSVAIHCMAGNMSAAGCGSLFADPNKQASSNYGIGSDGTIGVYVDEDNRSWCTSDSGVDNRAVTIEVANTSTSEPFACSDAAYESLIRLLVDICKRNNISSLKWRNDSTYAHSAANGGPVSEQNMFVHRWFANKSCPGEWLFNRHGQIAAEVNRRLGLPGSSTAVTKRTIVFIGDSRTVQMKTAVGANGNIWSCLGAMGLSWMKSTGVPQVESKIGSNSAVCILMGVNDMLLVSPSDYTSYINSKAATWVARGATVYFVSINPVRLTGYYAITNSKIQAFNEAIKRGLSSNVQYIDTFSQILNSFVAPDGLHYDATTYKKIYNIITDTVSAGTADYTSGVALTVDHTKFSPYLITLSRSSATPPYAKLQNSRIVGAIVEAGQLFNDYGAVISQFESPALASQVAHLSKYKIPFGLYMYGKARTVVDAQEEIYNLSFSIRRYPPKLGVWIQLVFSNHTTTFIRTKILERYRDDLIRLGFKDKIGIICTRAQLKTIEWTKLQGDFYLWLIDVVKDSSQFDQLFDPEFFDTDGK